MSQWLLFLSLCLLGCADSTGLSERNQSGSSGGDGAVCEPGRDQTCNDKPEISSLHGRCLSNGTCQCNEGIEKNPETERCL